MLDKFKRYYSKHPLIVVVGIIFAILSAIGLIYSSIKLFYDLYTNYNNLDTGAQILAMSIVTVIINIILIALVTIYLSAKIDDLTNKPK